MARRPISQAVDYYRQELCRRFPNARVGDIVRKPMGGFDVSMRVEAPGSELFDLLDATAELTLDCLDKYGVAVLAMVKDDTEPVPPTGSLRRSQGE